MGEAATKEPSMEDILSSIRKIIAEEGENGPDAEMSGTVEEAVVEEAAMEEPVAEDIPEASPASFREIAESVASASVEPTVESAEPAEPTMQERASSSHQMTDFQRLAEKAQAQAAMHAPVAEEVGTANETNEAQVHADPVSEVEEESSSMMDKAVETAAEVDESEPAPQMAGSAPETIPSEPEVTETVSVQMADAQPAPTSGSAAQMSAAASSEEADAFRGALMSPSVGDAVSDSFERLKRSAMDDIEAKTESILRPMLRDWLDENLPTLVERLVREEIERVARGV